MNIKLMIYKFKKFIQGYGTVAVFKLDGKRFCIFKRITPDVMESIIYKIKSKYTREKGHNVKLKILIIAPIKKKDFIKEYGVYNESN